MDCRVKPGNDEFHGDTKTRTAISGPGLFFFKRETTYFVSGQPLLSAVG